MFGSHWSKIKSEKERAKYREEAVSPPQHEEYYVYRRYSRHEESYDYYYGPHSELTRPRKRRIAPPPPPGFESPVSRGARRRGTAAALAAGDKGRPRRRSFSDEPGDRKRKHKPFENFKVTIKTNKNGDGTPSLSEDSDDDKKKNR